MLKYISVKEMPQHINGDNAKVVQQMVWHKGYYKCQYWPSGRTVRVCLGIDWSAKLGIQPLENCEMHDDLEYLAKSISNKNAGNSLH